MSTISFGGLATGLDTNSLISQLMQTEQQPLTRPAERQGLEQQSPCGLCAVQRQAGELSAEDRRPRYRRGSAAEKSDAELRGIFHGHHRTDALPGSYQVEVVGLAQVEKEVSQGYADKTARSFGTGTISLTVGGGRPVDIAIDSRTTPSKES